MAEWEFEAKPSSHILNQVYEGLPVYGRMGEKIGTVEYVYLGELALVPHEYGREPASSAGPALHETSLIEDFARAIVLTEQVPDILRERLLCHGFIRINSTGLFAADRCVMPDQIAGVTDERVTLRVARHELMKL